MSELSKENVSKHKAKNKCIKSENLNKVLKFEFDKLLLTSTKHITRKPPEIKSCLHYKKYKRLNSTFRFN
ncbi:hypothetical protein BpHYR1_037945 [Brachionus plicatilis]|uniref:Uncharacterized protein n=1 Tax=Brachionus plicatilis TaxID=10195 RepID=A0A3M7QES3_BRAPC|nr:hypothetical protein BpHYR1_037945 [Brachionus plicatilis]